jgi:4-diphosphocytidyl-2C-methyl-D-erythritol kinase
LVNSFERSVERDYPPVVALRHAFLTAGATAVHLSGSGPTLVALFERLTPAAAVWRRLRQDGHETWLAHTVARDAALLAASAQSHFGAGVPALD